MTQVHFTMKSEEIQRIIDHSVKDDVSKNILTTVFNQLMESERTEYIQAEDYERSESRQSQLKYNNTINKFSIRYFAYIGFNHSFSQN